MESLKAKSADETILVIEDETSVRHLSERVLNKFGYQVMSAEDGQAGLDMYMENHALIDLIILDMSMPRLSGPEVLDRIIGHNPGARVIISSGRSSEHYDEELFKKTQGYIYKPFQINELLFSIRKALDS